MKKNHQQSWLHSSVLRLARIHFLYVALLVIQIVVYDAWKLIAPKAVMQRWVITAVLLAVTTTVWYLAHSKQRSNTTYRFLVLALILADIAVASYSVYTQRGMASRAVALYAVPIITSTVLLSRTALFATAAICAASYTTAAISYFVNYFNEGYKIELYGEIGFYSAAMFLLAMLLWVTIRSKRHT